MDAGEASGRKKRPARGSRTPARRAALSDSDEELSSEEGSELEYEPDPAPETTKRARTQAKPRSDEGSGDEEEAAAFTQADLIEGEEDAARLAQMTELEREFELAERSERRQQEIQRRKLLRQARGLKPSPAPAAVEAEPPTATPAATRSQAQPLAGEQGGRSMRSGREEREEAAKKSAIQELVAARKSRAEARTLATGDSSEDESDRDDREPSESEEISDLDEDGEEGSVPLWQRRAGAADEEGEEEAGYRDACSIVVARRRLEKWLGEPFFETTLPGCLVRVSLGTKLGADGLHRQHYMLAQVVDVEQRKPGVYKDCGQAWHSPYPFGPGQEPTDAWLRVCRGTSERGMPLALVSNAPPSEAEWEGWQRACIAQHRPQLSRGEVAEVAARIRKAENYVYTAADVATVLERKRATGKAARNAVLERARLERQRDAAAEVGDAARVEQINVELEELQREVEAKSARRQPAVAMEDINRKNRNINFQNALHAVSNKVDEPHSREAADGEGNDTLDPFSRRVTRPQNYWSTKAGAEGEEAGDDATGATEAEAAEADAGVAASSAKTEVQRAMVDLSGLDLSLLDRPPVMHPMARRLLGSSVARLVIAANATARSRAAA